MQDYVLKLNEKSNTVQIIDACFNISVYELRLERKVPSREMKQEKIKQINI